VADVKGWLSRAIAAATEHGSAGSAARRWLRWMPGRSAPVDSRFQGDDEPFPRHWRRTPTHWPDGALDDRDAQRRLRRALAALPDRWREVLLVRDGARRPAAEVAAELDLDVAGQRRLLNQARAALRDAVADGLDPRAPR
jgi:DNA-directed RNA polymerase specialized sigma24 family protein